MLAHVIRLEADVKHSLAKSLRAKSVRMAIGSLRSSCAQSARILTKRTRRSSMSSQNKAESPKPLRRPPMSVDQLAHKPDAPKLPTTEVKPSVYISPEVVREIFEGVSPPVGEQRIHAAISKFLGKPAAILLW
jgi:hypothetical protein